MEKTVRPIGLTVLFLTALLLLAGCGRKGKIGEESRLVSRLYHTVWVDPQIQFADSLVTLIRAERIDSLKIQPGEEVPVQPASIEIPIVQPRCNVAVDLLDRNLRIIRPLMLRHLNAGYYRLTFNYDRLNAPALIPGDYFIRAQFCDSTRVSRFSVD
jgi:hypothetical protein